MQNRGTLTSFITRAEGQWLHVFYAGRKTKQHTADGTPLELMPKHLNSRRKIYQFFRLYWGKSLAKQMLRNLPLTYRCGRLHVIAYDAGPMSVVVRATRIVSRKGIELSVLTQLTGGPEGRVNVRHGLLRCRTGGYIIVKRQGPQYDFRYSSNFRSNCAATAQVLR